MTQLIEHSPKSEQIIITTTYQFEPKKEGWSMNTNTHETKYKTTSSTYAPYNAKRTQKIVGNWRDTEDVPTNVFRKYGYKKEFLNIEYNYEN